MSRELKEQKKQGTSLSNLDLSKMRDDMSQALHHLHKQNLKHGDIRPLYIGKDKPNNQHMLLDRLKDM
jgi:hypothetical protein